MEKFSINKRIKSFKYAFNGIKEAIKTQHNLQIHIVAMILTIFCGIFVKINQTEWLMLIIIFAIVIAMEIINSAVELLTDLVSPQHNIKAGKVKDMSAGAVLISAIAAFIIGIIIFVPKLIQLIF